MSRLRFICRPELSSRRQPKIQPSSPRIVASSLDPGIIPAGISNSRRNRFWRSRSRAQCHMERTCPLSLIASASGARTLGYISACRTRMSGASHCPIGGAHPVSNGQTAEQPANRDSNLIRSRRGIPVRTWLPTLPVPNRRNGVSLRARSSVRRRAAIGPFTVSNGCAGRF